MPEQQYKYIVEKVRLSKEMLRNRYRDIITNAFRLFYNPKENEKREMPMPRFDKKRREIKERIGLKQRNFMSDERVVKVAKTKEVEYKNSEEFRKLAKAMRTVSKNVSSENGL